nr:hypothetical protein [Saprospiraceae bacterium]
LPNPEGEGLSQIVFSPDGNKLYPLTDTVRLWYILLTGRPVFSHNLTLFTLIMETSWLARQVAQYRQAGNTYIFHAENFCIKWIYGQLM